MAKKQKIQPAQQTTVEKQVPQSAPEVTTPKPWSFKDFKVQAIIVALLSIVVYANSFVNEFAHDDGIVIVKNEYVLEGFAGLKDIFTKDAYDSYYKQLNTTNQLGGGRYRPLSIATFAVEQQFLGAVPLDKIDSVLKQSISYGVSGPQQAKLITTMHVRHVINVLIYALSVVVLLYFLRYIIFKDNPLMAFIAAVLFAVHPMHTEVVANVKSRDEIMSLLFMCLTFIFAFKYEDNKKNVWLLIAALGNFLLAFLSKEYAITIVALLPLALIAFRQYSIPKSITAILPYLIIVTVYLGLRLNVLAPPIENMDVDASTASLLNTLPYIGLLAGIGAIIFYLRSLKSN